MKLRAKTASLLTASLLGLGGIVLAEYPEMRVQFIVPLPPCDLEDALTGMIAEDFQAAYDVPHACVSHSHSCTY